MCLLYQSNSNSSAQTYPFPAKDAQWNILVSGFDPPSGSTLIYKYEKDTFLCGYDYSLIVLQNPSQYNDTNLLLRTSGEKIYGIKNFDCSSGESFLYDFGLSLGDTFMLVPPQTPYVVTSIDSITMLNGQVRLSQTLQSQYPPFQSVSLIEGVGHSGHFYWPTTFIPPEGNLEVLCFSDSSGLVYQSNTGTIWNTCDTTYTDVTENPKVNDSDLLLIHADYANETISIEYKYSSGKARLGIYDLNGRLVTSFNLPQKHGMIELNKKKFTKGMYLCSLSLENKIIRAKKFVIHK